MMLTLGHGTATAAELASLIRNAGIERIVDVRAIPESRRHHQYRREELEQWLPQLAGSAYQWQPALGGFRKRNPESRNVALRHPSFRAYADYMETPEFDGALRELLATPGDGLVAVMCSETLWWRCHRRLISDAATLLHSVEIRHLMHDGTLRPHQLTSGVRILEGKLRYDR